MIFEIVGSGAFHGGSVAQVVSLQRIIFPRFYTRSKSKNSPLLPGRGAGLGFPAGWNHKLDAAGDSRESPINLAPSV